MNIDPEAVVDSTKTGQPADSKESAEAKDSASTKENESPAKDVKETKAQSGNEDDPEADIDSDEEAALREAGL